MNFLWTGALLLAGLAHAWSLATPWDGQPLWLLQLLALVVLVHGLQHAHTVRQAFWRGWWFSLVWLTGTFWWLYVSMHTYGGLAAPLAALAVLALAGALSLYYAAAGAAFKKWGQGWASIPLFAALWLLAELARGIWWTGFGWGGAGYAHVDGPLAGYAPWLGVYGISALSAVFAASVAWGAGHQRLGVRYGTPALGLSVLALGQALTLSAPAPQNIPSVAVTLLQGNIPQDEKFIPGQGIAQALQWYTEALQNAHTPVVVAPETAFPLLPHQIPQEVGDALRMRFAQGEQAALLGIPLGNALMGYTNSVIALTPGAPYRYDKHHLVPFGEFIPPGFRWFTDLMHIPLSDFRRGARDQASWSWAGQRWAPQICYEDLFGEELGARFKDPASAPTVFVNLSNIAWFGNTVALPQHLHIARMRALEFARPVIRATNTGMTAVINAQGQVSAALPAHTRGILVSQVQGQSRITPYAWWVSRLGLWPLWLIAACVVLKFITWSAQRLLPPTPR